MAKMSPPPAAQEQQPPHKKVSTVKTIAKATPKAPTEQVPPDAIKPLQLKIPETRKNEFKAYAAMRGRSMNALFLDMFNEYKDKHA